jgi:predicted outer membrane repeat protein
MWIRRSLSLAGSLLLGLGLSVACLAGASASVAAAAPPRAPVSANIWRVNNSFDDGLAGYWKFDQVSGTATLSSAPLKFLTTLNNGASLTTTVPPSLTVPNFEALHLDGVNDVATVADDPALDVSTNAFSLAAWVRRATSGTAALIYDSGTQTQHWYFGFLDNNKLTFTTNGQTDVSSPFTVTDHNWHHVAAVVNGTGPGNLEIYLDGVASPPLTTIVSNAPTGPKQIGNKNGSFDTPFAGDIDDLRLYDQALSAAQVQGLASGSGCVTSGNAWSAPLTDLQCALAAAQPGDEIWVAKSLSAYRPGTNRGASFYLAGQVAVFGGFLGNEVSRDQRPPINFDSVLQTTLSGDLFGDDSLNLSHSDNAQHVVSVGGGEGIVLDGVRVEGGFATGSGNQGSGGGIFADGLSAGFLLANARVDGNVAANQGGGLFAVSTHDLGLNNVSLEDNHAHEAGGALVAGTVVITGGVFTVDSSDASCGGLENELGSLVVSGTTFAFDHAGADGGGACFGAPAQLTGALFHSDSAQRGGAALSGFPVAVADSQFVSNTAAAFGGGLYATGPLTVSDSLFAGNAVTGTFGVGGGLDVGDLWMTGSRLEGNWATNAGGVEVSGISLITGTTFLANQATKGEAGGLFLSGGPLTLADSLFVGNQAKGHGAALLSNFSAFTMSDVTAVQNQAPAPSDGAFVILGSGSIANSVFQDGPLGEFAGSDPLNVDFSLASQTLSGTGDISGTAQFVRAPNPGDGNWATLGDNDYGDLHLQVNSPGIDAGGNSQVPPGIVTDFDGRPRFVDVPFVPNTGAGTPPLVDMGAYEFQVERLFLPLVER